MQEKVKTRDEEWRFLCKKKSLLLFLRFVFTRVLVCWQIKYRVLFFRRNIFESRVCILKTWNYSLYSVSVTYLVPWRHWFRPIIRSIIVRGNQNKFTNDDAIHARCYMLQTLMLTYICSIKNIFIRQHIIFHHLFTSHHHHHQLAIWKLKKKIRNLSLETKFSHIYIPQQNMNILYNFESELIPSFVSKMLLLVVFTFTLFADRLMLILNTLPFISTGSLKNWKMPSSSAHRIPTGWSSIEGEWDWLDEVKLWNLQTKMLDLNRFSRGLHPSQYPPLYPHPGLQGSPLDRERLGLPPGPPNHLESVNDQMVSANMRE